MAGSVTVNGLISGLDTQSIIDQLIAIQARRIAQLEDKQAGETNIISLFQTLQANYLSLRTASDTLKAKSLFAQKTATSSNTAILTATASDKAALGSTQITVVQLATKQQFVTNRFKDTKTSLGVTGDLTITVGEGASAITKTVTLSSANNHLEGIRDAINASGAKVTASIVKVDDSLRPFKLLVTANDGGSSGKFTLSFSNALFLTTVTDEAAGAGKGTDTATTDDGDNSTFAFATRPNPGTTPTVKIDGATIQQKLASPTITTIENQDAGGALVRETTFHYKVTALDASGETVGSQTVSINTGAGGDDQRNIVTWNRVTGATSYKVYVSLNTDFSGAALAGTVADPGTGGTASFTHADMGVGTPLTAAQPPATATQGYVIDFDTGTVKFNQAQSGAVTLTYQHGGLVFAESEKAQDAVLKVGGGATTFTVTKNSNTITDLIEGVTLSLLKADSGATVIVDVKRDTSGVTKAVQSFVNAINTAESFIEKQSFFDAKTNTSGPLFGDQNVLTIRSRVSGILNGSVKSVAVGKLRALSQIGITLNPETGSYLFDSSKLGEQLSSKPDEVRNLLAAVGEATDPDVEVLGFTDKTKTSSSLGYAVDITQAATRAEDVGAQNVSGGITVNESLTITVGELVAGVNLTNGMSAETAVSAINTALLNAGIGNVRASFDSGTGKITLSHDEFGSKNSFQVKSNVASGTAGSSGLGSATAGQEVTFKGQDVKGTIGGEAATGEGQVLIGNAGNATTEGLQLRVTLTPAQLTAQGSFQGHAVVSRGIAAQLDEFLAFLTDETKEGPIQTAIDEADGRIKDLQSQIDAVTERAEKERLRLQREFTRLEQALGLLQTTSTFLERQIRQIEAVSQAFAFRRSRR